MIFALVLALTGVTAECREGMRDDPVLIVRAEKNHYVYFLPGEMNLCKKYAAQFQSGQLKTVCGCKILRGGELRDRLRLRCVYNLHGEIYSQSVAWYYYYPELTSHCKKTQHHLMFKVKL